MKIHNSMRGHFAYYLGKKMSTNRDIYVLTGDLGYKMFDDIRTNFKDRFFNCGASEQSMLDIAVGLAYEGKIPVVYSITPFLIYRGYETIRTYINHEDLNVKLIGGGRDDDYKHDGFSHDATDIYNHFNVSRPLFPNIIHRFPQDKSEMKELVSEIIKSPKPYFISLTR